MHFAESLRLNALRHPERTATVFGPARTSYKQLNQRVNRLANAFSGLGYAPGDKVAVLLYSGTEYLECLVALTKVGLIPVPTNHLLKDSEIAAILARSDSVAAIVDVDFLDRVMAMRHGLKHVVIVNGAGSHKGVLHYEDAMAAAASSEPDDRSRMCSSTMTLSSGTTGLPKGIIRSQYGFMERAIQQGLRPDYNILCIMPLFFSMGAAFTLLALSLGETMIFVKKFDAEECLRIIKQERVDATACVATMLKSLCDAVEQDKDAAHSLKTILTSGGQLPTDIKTEAFDRFGPILQSYFGASETGPTNYMGPSDLLQKNEASCVGKVFFGNEVVLLDDENNPVPAGDIGKICCRGPATYDCYYKDPEATAKTKCGDYVTVGDMGRFDEEGYLYFEGRTQDIIKTGGINVFAQEVEGAIAGHPEIKEVSVVGVPDQRWIEAVTAFIVLKEGSSLTQEDVIAFSKEKLASYKAPKSVEIIDALPRNLMGKVLKDELKKRFSA